LRENFLNLSADAEIDLNKFCSGRDGGAMAFLQIIEGDDGVAARKQDFGNNAADVARGAGDENIQRSSLLKTGNKRF